MNLLYFTQLFHPFLFGGGEYIFFLIARELAKRGHNVHVITQRVSDTKVEEVFQNIHIHRVGSEYTYSGTLPPTFRHNFEYLVLACKKGREIIVGSKRGDAGIDIIHSNTYVPAISGHICSKLFKIPHIVTFHDVYQASDKKFWKQWKSSQDMNLPFYAPLMSKIVERLILRLNVSHFHTVSDMTKEDLTGFGVKREKVSVIPNGIDKTDFQIGFDDSASAGPTAVFVGRLVYYKNLETVIRAFKDVVKAVPNARLVIIGDGPYKNNLVHEAKELNNSVVFAGRITHAEKIKIIAQASFMVFPSIIEGFGIAAIEGFACGKPVLVPDIRPLSDIVRDHYSGFVISAFDTLAWADRMVALFNDESKCKELGKNAYDEFLSKYEIGQVIDRIELLYKDVLQNEVKAPN